MCLQRLVPTELALWSLVVMGHRHRKHRCFTFNVDVFDIDVSLRYFEIDVSVFCHRSLAISNLRV